LTQQLRDQEKQKACLQSGITLIQIPYWWDRSKLSLQSTISQHHAGIG